MEHRALATLLCLTCFACGLDAPEGPTPTPRADAPTDGDAAVTAPLAAADPSPLPGLAPEVANAPVAPAVARAPIAVDAPIAEPEVDTAPPAPATAARLDRSDPLSVHRVLPALSADGRLILAARYEVMSDSLFVDVLRASNQRRVRAIELPLSGGDGALETALASVDRILERRGFLTLRELEPVLPDEEAQELWDAPIGEWRDGDLTVRYDAATGGLAVYREYALIHQSLVPARIPDGPGVGLMDPDYAELPMIPSADDVRVSADGDLLAIRLAACDCSCDIEPFWKLVALNAPNRP